MTTRSVSHGMFTIERTYSASPARVFGAFASKEAKARWFVGPDEWLSSGHELDFRVGGEETVAGGPPGGPIHTYRARYQDIVPDQRIVTTYEMYMDDARISVSVATLEFTPVEAGTRLVVTEQGAFLDGHDIPAERERGTHELLDALARELEREPSAVA